MRLSNKKICVLLLGRDNVGWSIDSDRENALHLFTNSDTFKITKNILKADIIYSVWYNELEQPWLFYPLLLLKKIKKVVIFAVITNRIENTPEKIGKLKKIIDIWVSPSAKTHTFIQNNGLNSIQIPFFVDTKIFYKITASKKKLLKKLNMADAKIQDKLLIGSFQRDSLGRDLSKPKWQKDPDLLITILKDLPSNKFILVLAGPRRHYLIKECKKFNLPYIFVGDETFISSNQDDVRVNNLSLKKINLLYNLIDVYLVTSKSEGGPKAILEAALTKTLIFSTAVGLAPDILHKHLIYSRDHISTLKTNLTTRINFPTHFSEEICYNNKLAMSVLSEKNALRKIKRGYKKILI